MTVQPGVEGTFRPPQFSVNTHDHEIREACEKKKRRKISGSKLLLSFTHNETAGAEIRNLALAEKF